MWRFCGLRLVTIGVHIKGIDLGSVDWICATLGSSWARTVVGCLGISRLDLCHIRILLDPYSCGMSRDQSTGAGPHYDPPGPVQLWDVSGSVDWSWATLRSSWTRTVVGCLGISRLDLCHIRILLDPYSCGMSRDQSTGAGPHYDPPGPVQLWDVSGSVDWICATLGSSWARTVVWCLGISRLDLGHIRILVYSCGMSRDQSTGSGPH